MRELLASCQVQRRNMTRVKPIVGALVLTAFVWPILGPAVAAASASLGTAEVHSIAAHHADGTPCPDGDDGPCDGSCACLCCLGHAKLLYKPTGAPSLVPDLPIVEHFSYVKDVSPRGIHVRVFRPPRMR